MVFIAFAIVAIYIGAMIYTAREIPESISQTVFLLPRKGQWLFTAVMVATGFLLLPSLLDKTAETTQFVAFITVAGVLFVGASPLVSSEKNVFHYVCAAMSGIASQLLVLLNHPELLSIWFPYVGYTLLAKDSSRNFFWVEVCCIITIFSYVLF